jgi:CRP-like cAMP-binding protein
MKADDFDRLRSSLHSLELKKGAILQDSYRPLQFVYFIEGGLVSIIARTDEGSMELATVGRTGFIGLGAVLGSTNALQRACVQIPGKALRLSASDLPRLMLERPSIRSDMLWHTQSLIVQQSRTAYCNAKHNTESKVARWLLIAQDNLESDVVCTTHDVLSQLLNATRPGITQTMSKLSADGVILASRGAIQIRDRSALVQRACQCYGLIRESICGAPEGTALNLPRTARRP